MTDNTYRTTTLDALFNGATGPSVDLYVYSTANNPDGADSGTFAQYIGTADNHARAAALWGAACAAASAIYGAGGDAEIGLCVKS